MRKILVLGAGDLALAVGRAAMTYEVAGFVVDSDDYHPGARHDGSWVYSLPSVAGWAHLRQFAVVSGTADPRRAEMVARLAACKPVAVVHHWADVHGSAEVGPGAFVGAGVVAARGVEVGGHAVVGQGALLCAGVTLGFCATVGAGAVLCEGVVVGRGATVGAGATVGPGVRVGEGATVEPGAVVLE